MKTRVHLEMPTAENVPIQQLTLEDVMEVMRQTEIPVLGRHHQQGGLREIRNLEPRTLFDRQINLIPRA